jgi:hypothetical protein
MADVTAPSNGQPTAHLSYKFQRLREQLRQAVLDGEFTGRMPGERELGRRFKANAKTINKALGDLSAEGLVMRHIGRGTFVVPRNGHAAPEAPCRSFKCVIPSEPTGELHRNRWVEQIRTGLATQGHHLTECGISDVSHCRQSLLASWSSEERRLTHGLVSFPADPLSRAAGRLDEATVAEIIRRHLPIVVVGALSQHAKLSAVVPDFSDAGFRLGQHLVQSGCQTIILLAASVECREVESARSGARAACARHGVPCQQVLLDQVDELSLRSADGRPPAGPIGILCIGATALQSALAAGLRPRNHTPDSVCLACVLEPGNDLARHEGVTHYAVSTQQLADWTVRLLLDAKPGLPPVEVTVPGMLQLAESRQPDRPRVRFTGNPLAQWEDHPSELAAVTR